MEKVIPDYVLETLICKSCDKYLTVGPIGIHPDGGNQCGRCLYRSDNAPKSLFEFNSNQGFINDEFIPLSLLGYINHCFPCINRYEGCKVKLLFGAVRDHELHCPVGKTYCGNCNYKGVGTQILHHYNMEHPQLVNQQNGFVVKLWKDLSVTFLVPNGECLVFIKFCYNKSKGTITFHPYSLLNISTINLLFTLKVTGEGFISTFNDSYCLLRDNFSQTVVYSIGDYENANVYCEFLLRMKN